MPWSCEGAKAGHQRSVPPKSIRVTGNQIGYGTISEYRMPDEAIHLAMTKDTHEIRIEDNFIFIRIHVDPSLPISTEFYTSTFESILGFVDDFCLWLSHRLTAIVTSELIRAIEIPSGDKVKTVRVRRLTHARYYHIRDRFFANLRVSSTAILAAHRQAMLRRVAEQTVILAVQDTTTLNLTGHRHTQGWGPIGQAGLSGFFLPACLAVSPDGVPLGLLGSLTWVRPPDPKDSHRTHKHRPLADKESRRWIDLMDAATAEVPPTTRAILVADCESDIFDVFCHAIQTGRDVLIRAAWDRHLVEPAGPVWAALARQPILGTVTVPVPPARRRLVPGRDPDASAGPRDPPTSPASGSRTPARADCHRRVGAGIGALGGHAPH